MQCNIGTFWQPYAREKQQTAPGQARIGYILYRSLPARARYTLGPGHWPCSGIARDLEHVARTGATQQVHITQCLMLWENVYFELQYCGVKAKVKCKKF